MNHLSPILDEISSLGPMRLQGLWGLLHALVLELYAHGQGRLYLICDYSLAHKSFHLQTKKPAGNKVITPLILALRKHALGSGIIFMRIEHQPWSLRAKILTQSQDLSLMFEFSPELKIGFFSGLRLLACARPGQAPSLAEGFITTQSQASLAQNFAQAERYLKLKEEQLLLSHVQSHKQILKHELKKKLALIKNLNTDLKKCELNLSREHDAELIKANISLINRGMAQVTLTDYTKDPPEPKLVFLDPRLGPQQQVEKIFNQVKRARRGLTHIKPRLNLLEAEIAALKLVLAKLDTGETQELMVMTNEVKPAPSKSKAIKRLPYRIFMSSDNIPIWVGRSARDNDDLTLHHSRGKEWWFHVREGTGSHVVVKSSDDALKPDTLLEAAMLAAHFSLHKNDANPEVCYTRIKHLRKPKGLAPGKVLIEQEKSIVIRMDQERIAKILH